MNYNGTWIERQIERVTEKRRLINDRLRDIMCLTWNCEGEEKVMAIRIVKATKDKIALLDQQLATLYRRRFLN